MLQDHSWVWLAQLTNPSARQQPPLTGLMRLLQSLVDNELRDRVTLRVDGGMRSGRDVLVSAALGGDEFGFGTVRDLPRSCKLTSLHSPANSIGAQLALGCCNAVTQLHHCTLAVCVVV